MRKSASKARALSVILIALAVGFFAFWGNVLPAYAYDDRYMGNSVFWQDNEDFVNIEKPDVNGILHYHTDKDNACAYFFIVFTDNNLSENEADFYLTFKIKNEFNNYVFSVNSSGVVADAKYHIDDNFNIYYDFSGVNYKYKGGQAFVAFEYKNSDDKRLNNEITCEYHGSSIFDITDSINIDMLVTTTTKPTTTKTTTQKSTATKTTTQKSTTAKTTKTTTEKSTKATTTTGKSTKVTTTTEKSTKFDSSVDKASSKSKTTQKEKSSTKFTPASTKSKSEKDTTKFTPKREATATASAQTKATQSEAPPAQTQSPDNRLTTSFKATTSLASREKYNNLLFVIALITFIVGAAFTIYGTFHGKNKIVKLPDSDDDNTSDNENKDDNTTEQNK